MSETTKTCVVCKKEKELDLFYNKRKAKDGKQSKCKECDLAKNALFCKENGEKRKEYHKVYNKSRRNKDVVRECNRKYKETHPDYFRDYMADYSREWKRKKRASSLQFRLVENIRRRTRKALKGKMKPSSVIKSFGCSDLASYIRSTYSAGMSDDNYGIKPGQWSIDHIVPLSSFDLSDPEQFAKANYYTNLQAMWHEDNMKKSNVLVTERGK